MLALVSLSVRRFSRHLHMSIPYYQIDAFTGSLFSGNPAGVCILAAWLPDPVLQSIAAENNLAETAFVVQRDSYFDLRWFTPALEMDLCGHATLAPAHVIFRHLGYRDAVVRFQTRAGELTVTRNDDLLRARLSSPACRRLFHTRRVAAGAWHLTHGHRQSPRLSRYPRHGARRPRASPGHDGSDASRLSGHHCDRARR